MFDEEVYKKGNTSKVFEFYHYCYLWFFVQEMLISKSRLQKKLLQVPFLPGRGEFVLKLATVFKLSSLKKEPNSAERETTGRVHPVTQWEGVRVRLELG